MKPRLIFAVLVLCVLVWPLQADESHAKTRVQKFADSSGVAYDSDNKLTLGALSTDYLYVNQDRDLSRCGIFSFQAVIGATTLPNITITAEIHLDPDGLWTTYPTDGWGPADSSASTAATVVTSGIQNPVRVAADIPAQRLRLKCVNNYNDQATLHGGWNVR